MATTIMISTKVKPDPGERQVLILINAQQLSGFDADSTAGDALQVRVAPFTFRLLSICQPAYQSRAPTSIKPRTRKMVAGKQKRPKLALGLGGQGEV